MLNMVSDAEAQGSAAAKQSKRLRLTVAAPKFVARAVSSQARGDLFGQIVETPRSDPPSDANVLNLDTSAPPPNSGGWDA